MAAISRITIDGFKAFPNSFTLDLGGNNLLMYGENGSGKSSIFYALHSLLQSKCGQDKNNVYFDINHAESIVNQHTRKNNAKVEIQFENSDVTYSISHNGYQESVAQAVSPVKDLNGKCVFINHKFLFNVFAFRNSQYIDLFPVFIKDILPFTLTRDQSQYISELYDEIMVGVERKNRRTTNTYSDKIQRFNDELQEVINKINANNIPNASDLYNKFFRNEDEPELRIRLIYDNNIDHIPQPGRSYWLRLGYKFKQVFIANAPRTERLSHRKELLSPVISLSVEEKQNDGTFTAIKKPQTYFNEAKLTAIALAIRFSLLDTISPEDGRFIALDDMLISLDMSNRTKVVDYLLKEVVGKYKIYLFTHDKYFFEYFKHRSKKSSDSWIYREIYMSDNTPYVRDSRTYLGNAEYYIREHEYEIAGNFLRKEAEAFCKHFLPKKWQYTEDYGILDLNGLIQNCIRYAKESNLPDVSLFDRLDDYRKFVLNPSSHDSYDVVKFKNEVEKCLETLKELNKIETRSIFTKGQKLRFTLLEATTHDIYEFEIKIAGDIRLIIQAGYDVVLAKGDLNYIVTKNGVKNSEQFTCTTLKKFYEKLYNKSDRTTPADYRDAIIDVVTGNPIRTLM